MSGSAAIVGVTVEIAAQIGGAGVYDPAPERAPVRAVSSREVVRGHGAATSAIAAEPAVRQTRARRLHQGRAPEIQGFAVGAPLPPPGGRSVRPAALSCGPCSRSPGRSALAQPIGQKPCSVRLGPCRPRDARRCGSGRTTCRDYPRRRPRSRPCRSARRRRCRAAVRAPGRRHRPPGSCARANASGGP